MDFPRSVVDGFIRAHFSVKEEGDRNELWLQNCPICGHNKWKTRFNVAKGVGICWRRRCHLSFLDLVRSASGEVSLQACLKLLERFQAGEETGLLPRKGELEPGLADRKALLRKRLEALRTGEPLTRLVASSLVLPESFSRDWLAPEAKPYLAYALQRRVPDWMFEEGRIGWCYRGKMGRRLIFLVHDSETRQPRYYLGRSIVPNSPVKVLYPPKEAVGGIGQSDVVFNLDRAPLGARILACEGAISALSAGEWGVAYLGHTVSPQQARLIAARKPSEVVLIREADVSSKTVSANARALEMAGCSRVSFANLTNGDPDDSPEQMPQVLASALPGDPMGRLRERFRGLNNPRK